MKRGILLCCLLALLLMCGCGEKEPASELERLLSRPASAYAEHVYSHRGSEKEEWPETFAAYDTAIAYGSRYLEQDLRMSADGVLYCSDEPSSEALTGDPRLLSEMTAAEIDALRTNLDGQCIPRLSAVFERYGKAVNYVVELRPEEGMTEALAQLIRDYDMQDHVILQSAELEQLAWAESIWPEMPKLFLCFDKTKLETALQADYVDIIGVSGGLFTQETCDRVHAAGKQFNVFVVNFSSSIRKAIEMGADSYFTDFTGKAFVLEELYRKK